MQRFKNILLALSGKDRAAIQRAVVLAKENNARLTAVSVLDDLPDLRPLPAAGLGEQDMAQLLTDAARTQAEKAMEPYLKKHGISASCEVLQGVGFVEIIRDVIEQQRDLVISSFEQGSGVAVRLFGSTNMHLMRKCPCPVWVVKPSRKRRYTRVLAAVDPTRTGATEEALNRRILEIGSSLAGRDDGEFHVVHAWELVGESILRGGGRIPPAKLEDVLQNTRDERQRQLEDLVARSGVEREKTRIHLLKGRPEVVAPRLVRRVKIDTLVMGTVSRSGLAGLLIGNTAENVLGQVDCSVLTVKPDDFVSPVGAEAA